MRISYLALALVCAAGAAQAQSSSEIEFNGSVSLGYSETIDNGGSTTFGALDLEATLDLGGGFGFEADYQAFQDFDYDFNPNDRAFYALTYNGDFGKVAFGVIEPASARIRARDYLGQTTVEDSVRETELDSLVYSAARQGDSPLGLSYEGTFGDHSVAVSYHNLDSTDQEIVSAAYSYDFGAYQVFATTENVLNPTSSYRQTVQIGAEAAFGQFAGRVILTDGIWRDPDARIVSLEGDYIVSPNVTVGGAVRHMTTGLGNEITLANAAAQYTHESGAFGRVDLGVSDGFATQTRVGVEVGYEF